MTISIERMKTLCDEATDGPWTYDKSEYDGQYAAQVFSPNGHTIVEMWPIDKPNCDNDVPFIAASRTFVPDAIQALEIMAAALRHYAITEPGYLNGKVTGAAGIALAAYNALANPQEIVKGDE